MKNKEFIVTIFNIEKKQCKVFKIKKPTFPEAASAAYLKKESLRQEQKGTWKIVSIVDNSPLPLLSIFTR